MQETVVSGAGRAVVEARDFLLGHRTDYVRRIEFGDLRKTISVKIRRVELRALEVERRASGTRMPMEFFEDHFAGDLPDLKIGKQS